MDNGESNLFDCFSCDKFFPSSSMVAAHVDLEHTFMCNKCDKNMLNKAALDQHISVSHIEKELVYKCNQCDEIMANKTELNDHVRTFHKYVIRFPCKQCDKDMTSKSELNNHIKEHRDDNKIIEEENYFDQISNLSEKIVVKLEKDDSVEMSYLTLEQDSGNNDVSHKIKKENKFDDDSYNEMTDKNCISSSNETVSCFLCNMSIILNGDKSTFMDHILSAHNILLNTNFVMMCNFLDPNIRTQVESMIMSIIVQFQNVSSKSTLNTNEPLIENKTLGRSFSDLKVYTTSSGKKLKSTKKLVNKSKHKKDKKINLAKYTTKNISRFEVLKRLAIVKNTENTTCSTKTYSRTPLESNKNVRAPEISEDREELTAKRKRYDLELNLESISIPQQNDKRMKDCTQVNPLKDNTDKNYDEIMKYESLSNNSIKSLKSSSEHNVKSYDQTVQSQGKSLSENSLKSCQETVKHILKSLTGDSEKSSDQVKTSTDFNEKSGEQIMKGQVEHLGDKTVKSCEATMALPIESLSNINMKIQEQTKEVQSEHSSSQTSNGCESASSDNAIESFYQTKKQHFEDLIELSDNNIESYNQMMQQQFVHLNQSDLKSFRQTKQQQVENVSNSKMKPYNQNKQQHFEHLTENSHKSLNPTKPQQFQNLSDNNIKSYKKTNRQQFPHLSDNNIKSNYQTKQQQVENLSHNSLQISNQTEHQHVEYLRDNNINSYSQTNQQLVHKSESLSESLSDNTENNSDETMKLCSSYMSSVMCQVCGDTLEDIKTLKSHILLEHPKLRFCMFCIDMFGSSEEFGSVTKYNTHYASKHRATVQMKNLEKNNQINLLKGYEQTGKNVANNIATCHICGDEQKDTIDLKTHILLEHSRKQVLCMLCIEAMGSSQEFSNMDSYNQHYSSHFTQNLENGNLRKIEVRKSRKKAVKNSEETVHRIIKYAAACQVCAHPFESVKKLKTHILLKHPQLNLCLFCVEMFGASELFETTTKYDQHYYEQHKGTVEKRDANRFI